MKFVTKAVVPETFIIDNPKFLKAKAIAKLHNIVFEAYEYGATSYNDIVDTAHYRYKSEVRIGIGGRTGWVDNYTEDEIAAMVLRQIKEMGYAPEWTR